MRGQSIRSSVPVLSSQNPLQHTRMATRSRRTRSNANHTPIGLLIVNHGQTLPILKLNRPAITNTLLESSVPQQRPAVTACFKEKYPKNYSKDLQINTVVSLINHNNTFLLAGTGYEKSRIPELFFHMLAKVKKPVVLVLDPLDTFVNNQIRHISIHGLI